MTDTLTYRLLNEKLILNTCLHSGPVSLDTLHPNNVNAEDVEKQAEVPPGTVSRFLKSVSARYGAYGYAALDGTSVIGQVRFYPTTFAEKMHAPDNAAALYTCIRDPQQVRKMASLNLVNLPPKSQLNPRSLTILCFQLVNDYKAMAEGRPLSQPSYLHKGIATNLLERTIAWARAAGWEEIRATAIPHIPPLMTWSCHLSVKRYERFGFTIHSSRQTMDGAVSQRRGYHGAAMQKMWEPYAHLSDDEVSQLYTAVLKLS